MDSSVVVTPPYLAGPLRLHPFRGLMLAPSRIGDPASARAFARPYRDVAARLGRWQAAGPAPPRRRARRSTCTSTPPAASPSAAWSAPSTSPTGPRTAPTGWCYPHEGVHPAQAAELADRMARDAAEPGADPARAPRPRRRSATCSAHVAGHDARPRVHRPRRPAPPGVGDPRRPRTSRPLDAALAGSRALIADGHHRYAAYLRLQQRAPGRPTDLGLAMLVDQDDTPLFLGAIHRVLSGPSLDQLADGGAQPSGWPSRSATPPTRSPRLGPTTLVATDGDAGPRSTLDVAARPRRRRGAARGADPGPADGPDADRAPPLGRGRPGRSSPAAGRLALLLPAPDFDLVLRIVAADRLLPEKATSFQPKPSIGVLIRSLRDE